MASERLERTVSLPEALQLRAEARNLLQGLLASRIESDRRQVESGRRDALKLVTGQSALDQAIATAEDMILTMDSVVAQLTGSAAINPFDGLEPPVIEIRPSEQRRPRFRRTLRTALNASFRSQPIPAVS